MSVIVTIACPDCGYEDTSTLEEGAGLSFGSRCCVLTCLGDSRKFRVQNTGRQVRQERLSARVHA